MSAPGTLLRAPPFPWAKAGAAAIATAYVPVGAIDQARLDALVAQIREARVGGAFWAPPADAAGGTTVDRTAADAPAVDPWSLLRPGVRLETTPGDEWELVALLAGAELRARDPKVLRVRLAEALLGVAYRDPFTGERIEPEAAVAILAGWRRTLDANRAVAAAAGMAWWKREQIARFLWTGRRHPLVLSDDPAGVAAAARRSGGAVAVWPSRMPAGLAEAGVPLVAVEDGFIRSVGLGADLHPPLSIVADSAGIYYDPGGPSDLEAILATAAFGPELIDRAERLRAAIVAGGISKYGSAAPASPPPSPRDRRTVLVAGQVEDDRSVRLGGAGVAGNLDLLARARAAEPDAHILFKPHPDVDAGHRVGRVADAELLRHADAIVRGEDMASLLGRVDAVHVLSSLTGFEALLRGLEVFVHGQPFYAGWGLTRDLAPPIERRTRTLTLPELVAGTLILYPRYLDPVTALPCPPEILLRRLAGGWRPRPSWIVRARRLQGRLFKLAGKATS